MPGAQTPRLEELPHQHWDIVDRLGTYICSQPVGTVLSVEQICAKQGVSRPVVREAMRVLQSKGLIGAKRGVGTTTRPPECWSLTDQDVVRWRLRSGDRLNQLRELLELRAAFEPQAAALAAERASSVAASALIDSAARLWSIGHTDDVDGFVQADEDFHRLLLAASGNGMLAQLSGFVAAILRGRMEEGLVPAQPASPALQQHLDLAHAIQRQEPETARRLCEELVSHTFAESQQLWDTSRAPRDS